jgi:hypothetical protein
MREPRQFGDALLTSEVSKLVKEFQYPDELGGGGVVLEGGGGTPTVVVAAADATDLSKSKADFICTGINDEDEIQAAIDLLPFNGGRVVLTEGEFHPDWDQIALKQGTHLMGMGMRATTIDMNDTNPTTGTGPVFDIPAGKTECLITDMTFQGPSNGLATQNAIRVNASNTKIHRVAIEFFQGHSIVIASCRNVEVAHCQIDFGELNGIDASAMAAFGGDLRIVHNKFNNQEDFAIEVDDCPTLLITDNQIFGGPQIDSGGIAVHRSPNSIINDNICGASITVDDVGGGGPYSGLEINGNQIQALDDRAGVHIEGFTLAVVVANVITRAEFHGVQLTDCSNCLVAANIINSSGLATDDTYDAIHLDGDSFRNLITGNKLIPPTAGNAPRYGVNIATTDECNIVVGNDLGDPDDYGTDALNDNGANTQLFWPNDATYGDNFTDCGTGS